MFNKDIKLPEVTFNKNGFEIRTEILGMAKSLMLDEYNSKYLGWQHTIKTDSNGQMVTSVALPEFPGLEKILDTAEKMYNFVNTKKN